MSLNHVTLDDKYDLTKSRIFVTGYQALVRLALMGDDHTAESSTTAHQSEFHFVDVMMPILNPAGVQEIIDYGLYGWAMSRFAGAWVGLKCMHETVESTAVVDGSLDRLGILL